MQEVKADGKHAIKPFVADAPAKVETIKPLETVQEVKTDGKHAIKPFAADAPAKAETIKPLEQAKENAENNEKTEAPAYDEKHLAVMDFAGFMVGVVFLVLFILSVFYGN